MPVVSESANVELTWRQHCRKAALAEKMVVEADSRTRAVVKEYEEIGLHNFLPLWYKMPRTPSRGRVSLLLRSATGNRSYSDQLEQEISKDRNIRRLLQKARSHSALAARMSRW